MKIDGKSMQRRQSWHALWVLALSMSLVACGGGSDSDPATPAAANQAPTANAGADVNVFKAAAVSLDASASRDPESGSLTFRWSQTSGAPVALGSVTTARPTFTAPSASGVLTFSLTVNDGQADSSADTVSVTVQNRAPVLSGAPLTTSMSTNSTLLIDGGANDPDGDALTLTWTQDSGPVATLTRATSAREVVTTGETPGVIVLRLTGTDAEAASTQANVTINVVAPDIPATGPPVVTFGDVTTPKRARVAISGAAFDPDGTPITRYEWAQTSGTPVSITGPTVRTMSFNAPETPGEMHFSFRAGHATEMSELKDVKVMVLNYAPTFAVVGLLPAAPTTDDTLSFTGPPTDPDQDPLVVTYEWRRNGVVVAGQTGTTFPFSLTSKGDVIQLRVTASDGAETETAVATTTIGDSLGYVTGSIPTAMNFGTTLTASLGISDLDGDAVESLELVFGPAGFVVSPTGSVSWTPQGPLFDKLTDFNWGVRIKGAPSSLVTGTIRVADAPRRLPLRRSGMHAPTGARATRVGDFDGDGSNEILVLSETGLAEFERTGARYTVRWENPFPPASGPGPQATSFATADVNGDGEQEIFLSQDTVLVYYDGSTRVEAARRNTAGTATPDTCAVLEVADLDRNGSLEAVCIGSAAVRVLDAATLTLKWRVAGGATSAAVGNVDADPALEIVLANGMVYDGATQSSQWNYGQVFGAEVALGDLDNDGVQEIVARMSTNSVRAYDAVARMPLWDVVPATVPPVGPILSTLIVADIDADQRAEVIIGDAQSGEVTAVRYIDSLHPGQVVFQLAAQDLGTAGLALGDLDSDGEPELVWGTGLAGSRDSLVVAGLTPAAVKWRSTDEPQISGGFFGGARANIAPGQSPLVFAPRRANGGASGVRIIALNPVSGIYALGNEIGAAGSLAADLDVVDYDGDTVDELFVCGTTLGNSFFVAYDLATNVPERSTPPNATDCVAATRADVTGDGHADLIAITSNNLLHVYDVLNQVLVWSTSLSGSNGNVRVRDLDHDGRPDIIVSGGNRLSVYRRPDAAAGPYVEMAGVALNSSGRRSLLVADTDGDGDDEIYTLSDTNIRVFDRTLQSLRTLTVSRLGVAIELEESDFERKNLLVAFGGGLAALDPGTGAIVWQSPLLYGGVMRDSVNYVDVNGDGQKELSIGAGQSMYLTR
jgi:hypothetical protein